MKTIKFIVFSTTVVLAVSQVCAEGVVVVSAKSSVTALTKDQVSDIFLGKRATFPDGNPALPVDQAEDSKGREEFYDKVTGKSASQLKSYWAKQIFSGKGAPPKQVSSDSELKKLIALNPNAVGYLEKSSVDASLKIILTP